MRRLCLALFLFHAATSHAEITSATLQIQGSGLTVVTTSVTTSIEIPTSIQTAFGGKSNDQAIVIPGLVAVADLTGPGIDPPIQLTTAPGHRFQIPGLNRVGEYYLQNVRLMNGGQFLQKAVPSFAKIIVADLLQTSVRVRQLTPEELRARGISVDARNWTVFEYTFSFVVDGKTVEIPFPVMIDPTTREARPIITETPYTLPPVSSIQPPRWSPPTMIAAEFVEEGELPQPEQEARPGETTQARPRIPAAIVIPNNLAVLHQFFAVALMVTNGAPEGSTARLEDLTAAIKIENPLALRTVKTMPPVAFGQPVPIVEKETGLTFLVALAEGEAEWTLEGLKPGTHLLSLELRATLRENGQEDVPLKATPRAAVVVHDPRFNITFTHPQTVRKGIDYSTLAFVTNMSSVSQTIRVASGVPLCSTTPNVCRVNGAEFDELTIPAGEMRSIEYKLRSGITGHVFATAGSVDGENVTASVQLTMGVSESGIPLSPTTLILPHYAQYVSTDLVSANLQLLGLGYSVATAPVNQTTAKFPRVIKTDVFQRAVDIARAGQRMFITDPSSEGKRDAIVHLALDLLGNGVGLTEWDELRRREKSGRSAGAAMAREIEAVGLTNGTSVRTFFDDFARSTAHRSAYVAVVAENAALSIVGASGRRASVANQATEGWIRDLPFADISQIGTNRELALVGRWSENVDVVVTSTADATIPIEIIYPDINDGALLRASFNVAAARGQAIRIPITRGATQLTALSANGGSSTASSQKVVPAPLRVIAARQDLYLDSEAHKVSVLFNRPVGIPPTAVLRGKFAGTITFNRDGVVFEGPRPISSAALQEDSRVVILTFDHSLSQNAAYGLRVSPLVDPLTNQEIVFPELLVPRIDNSAPAGIIYGRVLRGDGSPLSAAEVILRAFADADGPNPSGAPQYDASRASDGAFLFEYVRRDPENRISGLYRLEAVTTDGKYTKLDGSVRLIGSVHRVDLQFLGRGSAEGVVRYDNGETSANARVVIGSTMFDQVRQVTTGSDGSFRVTDLPVGPLTFSATDSAGNVAYAANEIGSPGQVVIQDITIQRRTLPSKGTIYGVVKRSDDGAVVSGARVGVFSQGYALAETFSDLSGRFEFRNVPSGFVSILAAEWSLSREAAAIDLDLRADEVREVLLTLSVKPNETLVALTGEVFREHPLFPGDSTKRERVSGAMVKIDGARVVTADADGKFVYDSIPVSFSGRSIQAYDPLTKRATTSQLPSLASSTSLQLLIKANDASGVGSIRVRLLSASGSPVVGYRVIVPGFPARVLDELQPGTYGLKNVAVGSSTEVWAVPVNAESGQYGEQFGRGTARVEFNGHVAALTLRLPGQGTVRANLRSDIDLIGDVTLSYPRWDEAEQGISLKEVTRSTNESGIAGYATFTKVPALSGYAIVSVHPVHGYASRSGQLGFDGDLATHTLQLNRLSTVRGLVYSIDGTTPISGATVRIEDGRQDQGTSTTQPDGSFEFRNVAAGAAIRVTAEVTQSGIYRTGVAYGVTPSIGGPLENLSVVLRRRGNVEGRVVYKAYKTYDPVNPANNVPDPTPLDLSDNAPVDRARLWFRELEFPSRSFGTSAEPLTTDTSGRFAVSNVFVGSVRASAWDKDNPDLRGDLTAVLEAEGQLLSNFIIAIGGDGVGTVRLTVVDPNKQYEPVANAEVSLLANGAVFDLATSDSLGNVQFGQVPAGTYAASAFSKALGRTGGTTTFTVTPQGVVERQVILEFSGKVTGTLTDIEVLPARPIAGSHVTLTGSNYQTRSTSDVAGEYVFNGVREGWFVLDAKDTETNRRATSPTTTLHRGDPPLRVDLQLEPIEKLHVSVYLPNDSGGNSNVLAPPVTIDVRQRCGYACDFLRSLQGNAFEIPGLFERESYDIVVREIGGEERTIAHRGAFPQGSVANPLKLVYPAFGSVDVTVTQAGGPAASARVIVSGGGRSVTVYTDSTGRAAARGLPLGAVSVQVTSLDGAFSGSAASAIQSQSTPAAISIQLGAYAGVMGLVEAEDGGPSVGTRVIASFGTTLETLTDGGGRYSFQGIPTSSSGTTVNLTFIAPDGVTVGARRGITLDSSSASKNVTVPGVRLDATSPQLLSIVPADGTANVSPDSSLKFLFSEPIRSDHITNTFFRLMPADSTQPVAASFLSDTAPDGSFVVTLTPPLPPPGQQFALRSNTLYRVIVSGEITDLTGNKLPAARGATFTTSDYAEPRVVKVTPNPAEPIAAATTFEFRFNEPIDPASFASGGSGSIKLYKLNAAGPSGQVVVEKAGNGYVDPVSGAALFFAPNAAIEPESFYRIVFSGVRDMQGNAAPEQTFHFFSYDTTKPFVNLVSPIPAGLHLVSGGQYSLDVDLRNGSAAGTAAKDVRRIDYYRVEGSAETYLVTVSEPPFAYRFVAPEAPEGGLALTIRARATDLSGNVSDPATITWTVKPNAAPKNVIVSVTPAALYPNKTNTVGVAFEDEGTFASVQVDLQAAQSDGGTHRQSKIASVTRTNVSSAWPPVEFTFALPTNLSAGTATYSATVTDARGLSATGSGVSTILADTSAPQVTVLSPVPDQLFEEGGSAIVVTATVIDAEVGVREVLAEIEGGATTPLVRSTPTSNDYTATIPVPFVEGADVISRPLTVRALDFASNSTTTSVSIRIKPLFDPRAPIVRWTCATTGAIYPAGYVAKLRVFAQGGTAVSGQPAPPALQKVEFFIDASTTPITGSPVSGLPDQYEINYTIPNVADGTPIDIRVVATNSAEKQEQAITRLVVLNGDFVRITNDSSIFDDTHIGKTIVVQSGTLTVQGNRTFARLIILDGARVTHLASTSTTTQKLEITTTGALFVSCGGSIDVTSRGYPAGATSPDAAVPGVGNGGSHIGRGGLQQPPLGSTYGSVYRPVEAGSGSGHPSGSAGGGIIRFLAATAIIDGAIRANGGGMSSFSGAAAGSIWITTGRINGAGTIETVGGADFTTAGGGGALALEYGDPASTLPLLRSVSGASNASKFGGAGSVYVKGPAHAYGELIIDNGSYGGQATELPAIGHGSAMSGTGGSTLVTDRSAAIPGYFVGHWVEITNPSGTIKGTWRVASISNKSVTLAADSGEVIALAEGDRWQGVYRFDAIKLNGETTLISADPIRLSPGSTFAVSGPTAADRYFRLTEPIEHSIVTIKGNVSVPSVETANLTIESGGMLTHADGQVLRLNVSGALTVNGSIDMTGRGHESSGDPGGTEPGLRSGGSHIGRGGVFTSPFGSTYGSVYRPAEPGAGVAVTCGCKPAAGGGVVRVNAGTSEVNGSIRSNGRGDNESGAGGSIWLTASRIHGTGLIEASGGQAGLGKGGGGAIAVEYSDPASSLPLLRARTGSPPLNDYFGGAGSVYVRGPTNTFGDLTVDNGAYTGQATDLPSLGQGTAMPGTTGATLVTDRASAIPSYFAGHWVEIKDVSNALKGTWRIATVAHKTVTLAPNSGEAIALAVGDRWQGVYRFDKLTLRQTTLISVDPIRFTTIDKDSFSTLSDIAPPASGVAGSVIAPGVEQAQKPRLSSVSFSVHGRAIRGIAVLTSPSPIGGAEILLSAGQPARALTVVAIPEGALAAEFEIEIACRPVDEAITITATYETTQATSVLIPRCAKGQE